LKKKWTTTKINSEKNCCLQAGVVVQWRMYCRKTFITDLQTKLLVGARVAYSLDNESLAFLARRRRQLLRGHGLVLGRQTSGQDGGLWRGESLDSLAGGRRQAVN